MFIIFKYIMYTTEIVWCYLTMFTSENGQLFTTKFTYDIKQYYFMSVIVKIVFVFEPSGENYGAICKEIPNYTCKLISYQKVKGAY